MITVDPFFLPAGGSSQDPVLLGVTRGLAQTFEPAAADELPEDLADLVRRIDEGQPER